ncbi:MAG: hypothetical protein JRJ08_05460 [Deltaproteobacteria bacterium]|nr:hypothetical protein [Deltaproteobacteria bacterium]
MEPVLLEEGGREQEEEWVAAAAEKVQVLWANVSVPPVVPLFSIRQVAHALR